MKRIGYFLLLLLSAGLLITCQELTPLTPPNPVVGKWTIYGWEVFHLPAWYVAASHTDYTVTPTDTFYHFGSGLTNSINSFTLAQDNTLSEFYIYENSPIETWKPKTDAGTWTLADTVVNLHVVNRFPHKLTYRYGLDQLVSDRVTQTAVYWRNGNPADSVRFSFTMKLYYRRGDP